MVLRNAFTEGMKKTMYGYFFESFDAKPSIFDLIYDIQPSDAAYEQSTSVVGMGKLAEKPEGEPIVYRQPMEGYTTYGRNRTFSDGVEMSMETVEDHQKIENILQATARTWGFSVKSTLEEYYAKTFNRGGFTSGDDHFKNVISGVLNQNAGGLVYDGKPFLNLSNNLRSSIQGGTYYNGLALSLSDTNLATAIDRMRATNNRNERDEIVSIVPDTLLVPPALAFTAEKIIRTPNVLGSANNDINVVAGALRVVVWDYLTDTDAWFVLKAKHGLVAQQRKQPVIDFYQDEDTKSFKANIVMRYGHRVDNWRFVVGSNFATS